MQFYFLILYPIIVIVLYETIQQTEYLFGIVDTNGLVL